MLSLIFICSLTTSQGVLNNGALNLFICDIVTGYGIKTTLDVFTDNNPLTTLHTDDGGRLIFEQQPGIYEFVFNAPGYKPLKTSLKIHPGQTLEATVHLDPIIPTPLTTEAVLSANAVFKGYIMAANTNRPLTGVKVKSRYTKAETHSDNNGYFALTIPVPVQEIRPDLLPVREEIIFERRSYQTLHIEKFLIPGHCFLKITMKPGEGKTTVQEDHGLFLLKPDKHEPQIDSTDDCVKCKRRNYAPVPFAPRADFLDPPPVIRVGTNCIGYNCASVEIMSLESYVQSGVDDEWIASWHYNALRSGCLAYRSYGAWHVAHPIHVNYDITNNTYCQVWQPDQYASCIAAARYTSGIMLEKNSGIARSEYSAENNDCGCGDGYAGTGTTWPCIYDWVCSGKSCFGHGRGMCQWGSQRWANTQARNWRWIVEHYYKPGSIYIATPLLITDAYPLPDSVEPLDTFTIYYDIYNGAEDAHSRIMLGASLHRSGNYISDPANDKKVTIPVGNSNPSRIFVVPAGTAAAVYDLIVALWFDIDENNQITGTDLPLYAVTSYDAVTVTDPMQVKEVVIQNPHNYSLAIHPNPVCSKTAMVKFHVPQTSRVQVKLFDASGREIATLVDGMQKPGRYEIPFNTAEYAQSIYFCQLKTERIKIIKKFVLLK